MQVRRATIDDLDALVALAWQFVRSAPYGKAIEATEAGLCAGLSATLEAGVVFVGEVDGELVGAVAGRISSPWIAPQERVAVELGWFVRPEHRGGIAGIRLLRAFEGWAIAQNARAVVMSDLVFDGEAPAGELFEKLGYVCVERAHLKGVA